MDAVINVFIPVFGIILTGYLGARIVGADTFLFRQMASVVGAAIIAWREMTSQAL